MRNSVVRARMDRWAGPGRGGFTLMELLVATTLTLMLLGAVITVFGMVSSSVADSRSTLEMTDRLRAAVNLLQRDLAGVTVTMKPPIHPESEQGYFQYTEGPLGPSPAASIAKLGTWPHACNRDTNSEDYTVGDIDDMLMFTTRNGDAPFVGKSPYGYMTSRVAEVAWFLRGTTLFRRTLLVLPSLNQGSMPSPVGFYRYFDMSVRMDPNSGRLWANSLGDLTKPENRFGHQGARFPFHPWRNSGWSQLGLPRLVECSSRNWSAVGALPRMNLSPNGVFDAWSNPYPIGQLDPQGGWLRSYYDGNDPSARVVDDVALTNVIGFDVKAWDPGAAIYSVNIPGRGKVAVAPGDTPVPSNAGGSIVGYGAYVDLGYENRAYDPTGGTTQGAPQKYFAHLGHPKSGLTAGATTFRVYDTWSTHYESDGISQLGLSPPDQGTDGFDNNGNGQVDEPDDLNGAGESETMAPYPLPLRGIQVKIRTFDPDSRQVREMTIVQDFLPQ